MPVCSRARPGGSSKTKYKCPHGDAEQPLENFRWFPSSERLSKQCNDCREIQARNQANWRARNPELSRERSNESARNHRINHPEVHRRAMKLAYQKDPERRKKQAKIYRERYADEPGFKAKEKARSIANKPKKNARFTERYRTDPVFREKQKAKYRAWYHRNKHKKKTKGSA